MAHVAKKLDKKFLLGHWIRTWDYRGATIQAKHYAKTPHLVLWSVAMPDGNGFRALTKTEAKQAIDYRIDVIGG